MKAETVAFLLLCSLGVIYMSAINKILNTTTDALQQSVTKMTSHEVRLGRIELAVSDVPAIRQDLEEIKLMLKNAGIQ